MSYDEHFQLDFQYGFTPKSYFEEIGQVAVELGENAAYKSVIVSAFQNNSILRLGLQYHFQETKKGWHLGLALSPLSSSGQADIQQVLAAATGLDYSNLENLLNAAGKSDSVNLSATLVIGEIQGAYTWNLGQNFSLSTSLGIAKVFSASTTLDTGLSGFESSAAGKAVINSSESSLNSILNQYGVSPTLGISFSYVF